VGQLLAGGAACAQGHPCVHVAVGEVCDLHLILCLVIGADHFKADRPDLRELARVRDVHPSAPGRNVSVQRTLQAAAPGPEDLAHHVDVAVGDGTRIDFRALPGHHLDVVGRAVVHLGHDTDLGSTAKVVEHSRRARTPDEALPDVCPVQRARERTAHAAERAAAHGLAVGQALLICEVAALLVAPVHAGRDRVRHGHVHLVPPRVLEQGKGHAGGVGGQS